MQDIRHQDEEKRRNYNSIQVSLFFFFFFNFCSVTGYAQQYLSTSVSLTVEEVRLDSVLQKLGKIGGFYFSYNSNALPRDSLVSISAKQEPIEKILNLLLKDEYEYKEVPGYVILRLAPKRLQLLADSSPDYGEIQLITGYVVDDQTGEKIAYASVYEKRLLLSALTDKHGFFSMKIKNRFSSMSLTVSKEYYRDTTVVFLAPVLISDNPGRGRFGYRHGEGSLDAERTTAGRLLISSKQKFQSLNLGAFFANAPAQTSLTPGLSTQGSLSSQVVNDFSLNILGGYTFGVKGLELAGLFNINKADMRATQAAGVFNLVGGIVHGIQLAGINNTVLDTVAGVQMSGLYNRNHKSTNGVQLAGIFNTSQGDVKGLQFAGLANVSSGSLKGVQYGTINYSKKVDGLQIGVANIADSSDYPIGIVNIIKNGSKSLGLSMDGDQTLLASFRSGGRVMYGIVGLGYNLQNSKQKYAFEVGLGTHLVAENAFSLNLEISSINLIDFDDHIYNKNSLRLLHAYKISPNLEVYAGPSVAHIFTSSSEGEDMVRNTIWRKNQSNGHTNAVGFGAIAGAQLYF